MSLLSAPSAAEMLQAHRLHPIISAEHCDDVSVVRLILVKVHVRMALNTEMHDGRCLCCQRRQLRRMLEL